MGKHHIVRHRPAPPRHYEGISHGRLYHLIKQRRPLKIDIPENAASVNAYVAALYDTLFSRDVAAGDRLRHLPELLNAYDHPDVRAECLTQGRALLCDANETHIGELIHQFVDTNLWAEQPALVGPFLGWLLATIPNPLLAEDSGIRLLNVFAGAERSGVLLSHMLQSTPDIAFALLERHQSSQPQVPLDMTSKLNLDDLRLFVLAQVLPKHRPYDFRDVAKLPPPIFENDFVISRVALSAHALLPRRWREAEERLGIVTEKREHRRRARARIKTDGFTETVQYVRGADKGNGRRHVTFEVDRPSRQITALRNGRAAADVSRARRDQPKRPR